MQKELDIINDLLAEKDISPITEETANEWFIFGGESFEEINEMAKTYIGDQQEKEVEAKYHQNSRYFL
jgi:hypothetical protein